MHRASCIVKSEIVDISEVDWLSNKSFYWGALVPTQTPKQSLSQALSPQAWNNILRAICARSIKLNSMREEDESFQSTFISITLASGRPESLMFTQFVHKSHWIQENSRWVASLPWSKIDRSIDQETLQNDTDFINIAVMFLYRRDRGWHILHTRRAS